MYRCIPLLSLYPPFLVFRSYFSHNYVFACLSSTLSRESARKCMGGVKPGLGAEERGAITEELAKCGPETTQKERACPVVS